MENIILVGHGSRRKDANNLELIGRLLHDAMHPGCSSKCVKAAYLQFSEPDVMQAIRESVGLGATKIIVHPYFLSTGNHVTEDIPAIIDEARGLFKDVEFVCTDPLGIHEKLVHVILERIHSANGLSPMDIEKKSFDIISGEVDLSDVPAEQRPIIQRVIHSTADFEFKKTLLFHDEAIKKGIEALRKGMNILTDIEMVRSGINKTLLDKWGCKTLCYISDAQVVSRSRQTGRTRSELAIEKGIKKGVGIVAIGNAPTALLKIIEMLNSPSAPASIPLVIGVPVGFVNALESKALLSAQNFPFITNLSRKGGTPVAVAIINALLKMADAPD